MKPDKATATRSVALTDLLCGTLREHISPDWKNGIDRIEYKIFDLAAPHCNKAQPYLDVRGQTRYRCRHDASAA
jgi:hypothetical protein